MGVRRQGQAFSSLKALTAAAALAFSATAAHAEHRIPLRPDMLLNETAIGSDAARLVDEQAAIGDPASGRGRRPETPFFPGWTAWQYPVHVLGDLGAERRLTRLFLYNDTGEHDLELSTGKPFAWRSRKIHLGGYREWRPFPLNVTTRYLRITLLSPTSLAEMALYGDGPEPSTPPVRRLVRKLLRTPMDQLVGTNAFVDDPIGKLAASVGFVREYHSWLWDTEAPDHRLRFQPSGAAGGNLWFFDDFYRKLAGDGVTVCPCIQRSSPVYFPGANLEAKPISAGADPEAPGSYRIHAAHLFQFAARYGSAHVDDSRLQLGPGQPRLSGLGTLRYFEDWNEPDKTWEGRAARFNPYELAAMCSADYDGDQGRMSPNAGVRGADPRARLVMGGLAGIRLDYLRAMKLWADFHRGGDFPANVINLHHYSSDGTEEQAFKTTGISPEADHLREKLQAITEWRDANVPDRQVWLTEFGYDTSPKSPLHAPAIGAYSAEEVQAIWLLRSYFALAAAGVDRAAMFMFRDAKSDGGGVFETCGMVTEKGKWEPKPSYYYIATLKKRLAGMRFSGEVPSGNQHVLIYRFAGPQGRAAYAVWCRTSADVKVPGISLAVAGRRASLVEFEGGSLDGRSTPLPIRGGRVTVNAREKPVLVITH